MNLGISHRYTQILYRKYFKPINDLIIMDSTELFIKKLVLSERVLLKKHCIERMNQRNISSEDITFVLKHCEVIKVYPDDRPLVSYLVLGFDRSKKPLHILMAIDEKENWLWIVTVYIPDQKIWSSDFKERK